MELPATVMRGDRASGEDGGFGARTLREQEQDLTPRDVERTQYTMLALMVLYTCTGLWLLSSK